MNLFLQGKTALVIGVSRGLGFAIAHLLSSEGANVVINSRNQQNIEEASKKIQEETGGNVLPVPGNITDPLFPEIIIPKSLERFGGLDIVIANAGGPQPGSFIDLDDKAWYQAIELSLMSQVRLIRAALPALQKSNNPSVLTITSISVKQPSPNLILSSSV